jgi:hypothetical protein
MKLLLFAALTLLLSSSTISVVDASTTRVAVIELGATHVRTIRRTTSNELETSVDGVSSFWSALHGYGRKLQHAGMPLVPDLFSRPHSGVVIGLTGVDLDTMPTLNNLMMTMDNEAVVVASSNNNNNINNNDHVVVGHMNVPGKQCKNMMKNVKQVETVVSTDAIRSSFESRARESGGFGGLQMEVTASNATDIDAQIALLINDHMSSLKDGKTIVLHLIVEEEDGAARRHNLARRLEEGQGEGQNNANNNADGQQNNNGFYGYGYFNGYGEWVTPYKTMFQIQYFNVVLWTAVGLVAVLFFAIYLMVYMPLMADTLLFGETARMSIDD